MAHSNKARPGRLLAIALAAAALLAALGGGTAFAADEELSLDPAAVQQLFQELQSSPVIQQTCSGCHGNIADTDNYSSEIIFTHANHIMLQCSSCHTRFPHRPEGTSRPVMKGCFDCHGLSHGPMGELATGECSDCHQTDAARLRPAFHTYDWSGKAHVAPANAEFNTRCAMCHTDPATCTDCHDNLGIKWSPAKWGYDSGAGCLSCHGNPLLQKQGLAGGKSFEVSGLEQSVHQDLTCQECHNDFNYDETPPATQLWTLNASKACADCHTNPNTGDAELDKRLSEPVELYNKSIHATALEDGKTDSATCGSCHGGHFIYSTETVAGQARMHQSSYRVCARCKQHGDEYDTYDDYYHGKAYKTGAPDAPACWDCHMSHDILPQDDPVSAVSDENVGDTCATEGCHTGSSDEFGAEAAALIHQKAQAEQENPLLRLIANLTGR